VIDFGHLYGVLRLAVYVVTEHDGLPAWGIGKILVDSYRSIASIEKDTTEFLIFFHSEV
jgi:hypothetical protein